MLVDFGLAKRAPSDHRLFTVCGSIEYMAPEVISYPSNPNPNL